MSRGDPIALEGDAGRARRLWAYFVPYWGAFAGGAVFLVITNVLALAIPGQLGAAIQLLKDARDGIADLATVQGDVTRHAVIIVVLALGAGVARIVSRVRIFNAGRDIEYDLRNRVFEHLTTLSPRFYQTIATGDLTSRVINDTTYVRLLYGMGFLHSVNTLVAAVVAITLMFGVDLRLTLYCLAPFPVIIFFVQRLAKRLHDQTRRVQEKLAELSAQCQEDLSGAAVVKAYAIEEIEGARFEGTAEEYVDENLKLARIRGLLFPLMMSLGSAGMLLVLYFGGRAVIVTESIKVGEFIEFAGYVARLAWPFMALGWVISVWERGTAAFDRIQAVLASVPDIIGPDPSQTDVDVESGTIEFRGVSFRYDDGETDVLRDIDLSIANGARVGIVGRSGAGKTALVNLIPRLADPTRGEIRIDGKRLPDIPLERLRAAIGYAPQEPFLFSTTLRKNIRFGLDASVDVDDAEPAGGNGGSAEVGEILDIVQLADDVRTFPKGLETMVGERGITLSGGQKQRSALARALLRRPRILILDDSLSSVDTRTERAILDHLDEVMADRTALVVTHRFNVLEVLDEIIVMAEGRIVERGPHDELMARPNGVYAAMVKRQKLKEELSVL